MEWDNFAVIKQKFIQDLINELKDLELPPEWSPRDVIGYIVRKIEDKGNKI
jgi:hypothetical protein